MFRADMKGDQAHDALAVGGRRLPAMPRPVGQSRLVGNAIGQIERADQERDVDPTLDWLVPMALAAWLKFRCSATASIWIRDAKGMRDPSEVGIPHERSTIGAARRRRI